MQNAARWENSKQAQTMQDSTYKELNITYLCKTSNTHSNTYEKKYIYSSSVTKTTRQRRGNTLPPSAFY